MRGLRQRSGTPLAIHLHVGCACRPQVKTEALFNVGGELGACLSFIFFIASGTGGADTSTMKTNQNPPWVSLGPIPGLVSFSCVETAISFWAG